MFVLDKWLRPVPAGWSVSCMWLVRGWPVGMCIGRG